MLSNTNKFTTEYLSIKSRNYPSFQLQCFQLFQEFKYFKNSFILFHLTIKGVDTPLVHLFDRKIIPKKCIKHEICRGLVEQTQI